MSFIPVCEPFLNGNEKKYVLDCIESGWISSAGEYVTRFEESFANYCNSKYAVAVSNGTVAIHLALTALGIKQGDEVIIPNFTMIATAFAVCYTGAIPVFVDSDKESWNIDTNKIEEKITNKTKAILYVSVFGQPCNMEKLWDLSNKYDLKLIEDAAESHGAEFKGRKVGSLADITTFSFFANKNLTTGEGGIIVTDNIELYEKCKYFKNMCFPLNGNRNYVHNDIGFNYRMTNIHAAIGLAQIERADYYRSLRVKNGDIYKRYLKNVDGIIFQNESPNTLNVRWMNVVVVDSQKYGKKRDELLVYLKANGIDTRLLFVGMHMQPSLINYGCDVGDTYSITEWLTNNGFYLPSASNLTEDNIRFICSKIVEFKEL